MADLMDNQRREQRSMEECYVPEIQGPIAQENVITLAPHLSSPPTQMAFCRPSAWASVPGVLGGNPTGLCFLHLRCPSPNQFSEQRQQPRHPHSTSVRGALCVGGKRASKDSFVPATQTRASAAQSPCTQCYPPDGLAALRKVQSLSIGKAPLSMRPMHREATHFRSRPYDPMPVLRIPQSPIMSPRQAARYFPPSCLPQHAMFILPTVEYNYYRPAVGKPGLTAPAHLWCQPQNLVCGESVETDWGCDNKCHRTATGARPPGWWSRLPYRPIEPFLPATPASLTDKTHRSSAAAPFPPDVTLIDPNTKSSRPSSRCSLPPHACWQKNQTLHDRYKLTRRLGEGTFGRVVEAIDQSRSAVHQTVAIKIVKDDERIKQSALEEAKTIVSINSAERIDDRQSSGCSTAESDDEHALLSTSPTGEATAQHSTQYCVKLLETFVAHLPCHDRWKLGEPEPDATPIHSPTSAHLCLVFEKLGCSLYDLLRRNDFVGMYLSDLRATARSLLQAIAFLHDTARIVHTDIKPENVLFVDPDTPTDYHTPKHPQHVAPPPPLYASSPPYRRPLLHGGGPGDDLEIYVRPRNCQVKLIDMGSAAPREGRGWDPSVVINTLQYRAPEVLLGLPWDHKSDIWCFGAVLAEMYTGRILFDTHDPLTHLTSVEFLLQPFDPAMLAKAFQMSPSLATRGIIDPATGRLSLVSDPLLMRDHFMQPIEMAVLGELKGEDRLSEEEAAFASLLRTALHPNPAQRPAAHKLLSHPFFDPLSLPPANVNPFPPHTPPVPRSAGGSPTNL